MFVIIGLLLQAIYVVRVAVVIVVVVVVVGSGIWW